MKTGRIIVASLATFVFATIVGMLTCAGAFNWVYQLEPTSVWKPMENGPEPLFFMADLIVSIIFVLGYSILKKGIPGYNKYIKGFVYGLVVFSVGVLPGLFSTYFFMTVNPVVVIYWAIWGLIVTPIKGIITATICPE